MPDLREIITQQDGFDIAGELERLFGKDDPLRREASRLAKEDILQLLFAFIENIAGKDTNFTAEDLYNYWNAIVMKDSRPVYSIIDNKIRFKEIDGRSAIWITRLGSWQEKISEGVPAIGRINVANYDEASWLGTGWFVSANIVVTNRHLALKFSMPVKDSYPFLPGNDQQPMRVSIDVSEEVDRNSDPEKVFSIKKVKYIAPATGPDLAFLEVDGVSKKLPLPIKLATEKLTEYSDIVTIGYPGRWAPRKYEDLMDKIYRKVEGKKRIAPGKIIEQTDSILYHDCCTLRGSSGSAILDPETGQAIALHVGGKFMLHNYGVPACTVCRYLKYVETNTMPCCDRGFTQEEETDPFPEIN